MKEFLTSIGISMCFITGSHMPYECIWGNVLKLLFFMLGFALIEYSGKNYKKWNDE